MRELGQSRRRTETERNVGWRRNIKLCKSHFHSGYFQVVDTCGSRYVPSQRVQKQGWTYPEFRSVGGMSRGQEGHGDSDTQAAWDGWRNYEVCQPSSWFSDPWSTVCWARPEKQLIATSGVTLSCFRCNCPQGTALAARNHQSSLTPCAASTGHLSHH